VSFRLAPALLVLAVALALPAAGPRTAPVEEGVRVIMSDDLELYLQAYPRRGEGWVDLTVRITGGTSRWREVKKLNGDKTTLRRDLRIAFPLAWVRPSLKAAALTAFFPGDAYRTDGWHHVLDRETLWHAAVWFTGDGKNYRAIREYNDLPTLEVKRGQTVVIPPKLLWKGMARHLKALPALPPPEPEPEPKPDPEAPGDPEPAPAEPSGAPADQGPAGPEPSTPPAGPTAQPPAVVPAPSAAVDAPLAPPPPPASAAAPPPEAPSAPEGEALPSGRSFVHVLSRQGSGMQLEYRDGVAVYRLKKGEALYSAVVMRFTGVDEVEEVLRIADEIARLSGITDVTKIPAGFPVKIPRDLLLPQYLPRDSAERRQWEAEQKALEEAEVKVEAPKLEGIHIILDAGHGGRDTGAIAGGLWESTYVYDIYIRLHNLLLERTKASVLPLVQDNKSRFTVVPSDRLPQHRRHSLLTEPPQALGDPQAGVNMRWKMANQNMAELRRKGVPPENVVFLSIHADALHPSVRGTTIYIPGAAYCKASSRQEAVRAEALSKALAEETIDALYRAGVPIHPYQPIRNRIIRTRSYWLPAVLKMNHVPTKMLVEVANLNNPKDREAVATQAFRQTFAESLVEALVAFYAAKEQAAGPSGAPERARARR
jgi:N-acetylmuramoyl-L-alanine amidase